MTAPSPETRELAAAIREALAVPAADSREPDAAVAEERLLARRSALLRGVLDSYLAGADTAHDVAVTVRTIRSVTADTPVTYPVHQNTEVPS